MKWKSARALDRRYRTTVEEMRVQFALTQEQLCEQAGISRSVLSKVENGAAIGDKAALRIATALGVHRLYTVFVPLTPAPESPFPPEEERSGVTILLDPRTQRPCVAYHFWDHERHNPDAIRYAEQAADGTWQVSVVTDQAPRVGPKETQLLFDAAGQPHLVFQAQTTKRTLYHAWRVEGQWQRQALFSSSPQPIGTYVARFDAADQLHVVYATPTTAHMVSFHYAYQRGGSISSSAIDAAAQQYESNSLNLDFIVQNDVPQIGMVTHYPDGRPQDVRWLSLRDETWQTHVVLAQAAEPATDPYALDLAWIPTLRLLSDANNVPHLLFLGDTAGCGLTLFHAYLHAGIWLTEKIPIPWQSTNELAAAFDAHGGLHVVAASLHWDGQEDEWLHHGTRSDVPSTQTGGIWYLHRPHLGWLIEQIAEERFYAHVSLALDSTATPHVAFSSLGRGGLWYATRHGPGNWITTLADGAEQQ